MNKETRYIDSQFRSLEDSRTVEGYALVFNSQSEDLGGFVEIIDKNALDGVLENSDVLCLLNHNEDKGVLARSRQGEGSLTLSIDEVGLKYTFQAPNTALGDELLEGLKRKDITSSSFAFSLADNGDKWEKQSDGTYIRTILKFDKIFDVSPVYNPAYLSTSVNCKRFIEVKKIEIEELNNYWLELEEQIKD